MLRLHPIGPLERAFGPKSRHHVEAHFLDGVELDGQFGAEEGGEGAAVAEVDPFGVGAADGDVVEVAGARDGGGQPELFGGGHLVEDVGLGGTVGWIFGAGGGDFIGEHAVLGSVVSLVLLFFWDCGG